MGHRGSYGLTAVILVLSAALTTLSGAPSAAAASTGSSEPVMVVLDTSGSMQDRDAAGTVKLDAARSAVLAVVDSLNTSEFGLIQYPGTAKSDGSGCSPGNVVTGLGALDVARASADVRRLRAEGDTPTGPALQHAADIMKNRGYEHGIIVLVSDGDWNCGADPCTLVPAIHSAGIDVVVNTVGFNVSGSAEESLQCVADASGGKYVSVSDTSALEAALENATSPVLDLGVAMPDKLAPVVGSNAGRGTKVPVTVTNTGRIDASDVRLTLQLSAPNSTGAVAVTRPVIFVGNLAAGATATREFLVRPQQTAKVQLTWTATATAAAGKRTQKTGTVTVDVDLTPKTSMGVLFTGVDRVAIVGDSYSSGEGAPPFLSDTTGSGHNHCHRSDGTYGKVIWGPAATLIACSGAVTADMRTTQVSGGVDVTPQLKALRAAALSDTPPQAVFLTLGGNDANFPDIARRCILRRGCQIEGNVVTGFKYGDQALAAVDNVYGNLTRAYDDIDSAVNDNQALKKRGGKVAPIVVLPYVQITPTSSSTARLPKGCQFGLSSSEMTFLNIFLTRLNTVVLNAVTAKRLQGRPFYYAADVIDAFQPDHTICETSASYANLVSVASELEKFTLPLGGEAQQQLLHPNAKGYIAIARALAMWSSDAKPITDERAARPAASFDPSHIHEHGFWDHAAAVLTGPFKTVLGIGNIVKTVESGFSPGAQVSLWLESSPRLLGAAVADEHGQVHADLVVPADVPTGPHHLIARGVGPDGLVTISQAVMVRRAGTYPAALVTLIGFMLLAAGTVGWRRR
jgi:lysophospholipase L1-like esterase